MIYIDNLTNQYNPKIGDITSMKTNPPVKQPTKNNKSWLIKKQALDVAENLK